MLFFHLIVDDTPKVGDFNIPESECEKCIEFTERRKLETERRAEVMAWFITHVSVEIDAPVEWKNKVLNKILPNN